jgi:hypothetical protein
VLSGDHTFQFEPSKTTPGGTTFINSEIPARLNILVFKLIDTTKMFTPLCVDFKARVEKLKAEGQL